MAKRDQDTIKDRDNALKMTSGLGFMMAHMSQNPEPGESPHKRPRHPNESSTGQDDIEIVAISPSIVGPRKVDDASVYTSSWRMDNRMNPYHCGICDLTCTSAVMFDSHIQGKNHARRVAQKKFGQEHNLPANANASTTTNNAKSSASQQNEAFYCHLCDLGLTSQVVYDAHIKGKNHFKRLKKLASPGGETSAPAIKRAKYACLEDMIREMPHEPVIGMQYIEELRPETNADLFEPKYSCNLCIMNTNMVANIFSHIVGSHHRLKYMHMRLGWSDVDKATCSDQAKKVERLEGRTIKPILIIGDGRYHEKLEHYNGAVAASTARPSYSSYEQYKEVASRQERSEDNFVQAEEQQHSNYSQINNEDSAPVFDPSLPPPGRHQNQSYFEPQKSRNSSHHYTNDDDEALFERATPKVYKPRREDSSSSRSENETLVGSNAEYLFETLSKCAVKNDQDAELAFNVASSLVRKLADYSSKKAQTWPSELFADRDLVLDKLKAIYDFERKTMSNVSQR